MRLSGRENTLGTSGPALLRRAHNKKWLANCAQPSPLADHDGDQCINMAGLSARDGKRVAKATAPKAAAETLSDSIYSPPAALSTQDKI